ncbi:MAG: hypothetical protein DRP28_06215 [Thermodesulfobacteriota bacterium]|nr:MAG: hypothetical protein DRP28_06215 [Thermodesulfobacteriota bacterium]RLB89922.1 MAG: hypothetical protein DRH50_13060 [Deltaproteobacteria bacterium]
MFNRAVVVECDVPLYFMIKCVKTVIVIMIVEFIYQVERPILVYHALPFIIVMDTTPLPLAPIDVDGKTI